MRTAEIYLFDTCTHKCAYCHLAETGKVMDSSQIAPYRDEIFIRNVAGFFNKRSDEDNKWLLTLTGGEPLLMPNLRLFSDLLGSRGNKIAYYTAMLVSEESDQFQYLLTDGVAHTDYIMASFHPEAEGHENIFFGKLKRLSDVGHNVIVRMVGAPSRLHRLQEISDTCREMNFSFYPTVIFSPEYPAKYTDEERQRLTKYFVSFGQYIQLKNGLSTSSIICYGGSRIIAIDMRTGNITPCISVHTPVMGNIYEDNLDLFVDKIRCPVPNQACVCDVHYQQSIIPGADDKAIFERQKNGFINPGEVELDWTDFEQYGYQFNVHKHAIGQTESALFGSLSAATVREAYRKNQRYFKNEYAQGNHTEFSSRQFSEASIIARSRDNE